MGCVSWANERGDYDREHYASGLACAFDGAIVFGMPLYIPGHSARPGGLFFTRSPRAGALAVRATGSPSPDHGAWRNHSLQEPPWS